jgi:hypothetical protein
MTLVCCRSLSEAWATEIGKRGNKRSENNKKRILFYHPIYKAPKEVLTEVELGRFVGELCSV